MKLIYLLLNLLPFSFSMNLVTQSQTIAIIIIQSSDSKLKPKLGKLQKLSIMHIQSGNLNIIYLLIKILQNHISTPTVIGYTKNLLVKNAD